MEDEEKMIQAASRLSSTLMKSKLEIEPHIENLTGETQ